MSSPIASAVRRAESLAPRVRSAQVSSGNEESWTVSVDSQGASVVGVRSLGPQQPSTGDHVYLLEMEGHQNPMAWEPSPFRSSLTTP